MNTTGSDLPSPPEVKLFLPSAIILLIVGWGGLYFLAKIASPTGGTRWLMFFLGFLAITGTALIPVAFLNRRFPSLPPPTPLVILRQSLWVGIYLTTLARLQTDFVLTLPVALLLALGLILIEWMLRLRERSQWKPRQDGAGSIQERDG